jgi:hypothetical protein
MALDTVLIKQRLHLLRPQSRRILPHCRRLQANRQNTQKKPVPLRHGTPIRNRNSLIDQPSLAAPAAKIHPAVPDNQFSEPQTATPQHQQSSPTHPHPRLVSRRERSCEDGTQSPKMGFHRTDPHITPPAGKAISALTSCTCLDPY